MIRRNRCCYNICRRSMKSILSSFRSQKNTWVKSLIKRILTSCGTKFEFCNSKSSKKRRKMKMGKQCILRVVNSKSKMMNTQMMNSRWASSSLINWCNSRQQKISRNQKRKRSSFKKIKHNCSLLIPRNNCSHAAIKSKQLQLISRMALTT